MGDREGFVIVARSLSKMGNLEPVAAEASAIVHTIAFCKEIGILNIILEGNALQVVQAMNSIGRNCS